MKITLIEAIALAALGVAGAFALSLTQSLIGSKIGSDHPVHAFLTRAIRNNGHRLFVRIPKILNTAYCAALPLYIHWLLSHVRTAGIYWSERLLNPVINTLHVVLFTVLAAMVASSQGLPVAYVGLTACLFALTPQFYHAMSARNFGLSARGTGLLLLTTFLLACHGVETDHRSIFYWALLLAAGWLIWGFSTFTQQALCILSALLLPIGGHVMPLVGTVLGFLIFMAAHPIYARGYLKHTLKFIHVYANELAPIYILQRRKSIWRDLVWDIWARLGTGAKNGVKYAYENSVVVLVLLNPLVVVACYGVLAHKTPATGLVAFAGTVSLAGAGAMLLTSFRPTRFLGEPERYVEAVTPWAVVAGAYTMHSMFGMAPLAIMAASFLVLNLMQIIVSKLLLKHITSKPFRLEEVETAIRERLGDKVRCCSNNEQITKMLMHNDWDFAYCIAVGQDYCGMKVGEAFSTFPYLRREACERIVRAYRIDICVLDRTIYETLFDTQPPDLAQMEVIHESAGLRVLLLGWRE